MQDLHIGRITPPVPCYEGVVLNDDGKRPNPAFVRFILLGLVGWAVILTLLWLVG